MTVQDALATAVVPSRAEIVTAKQQVLEHLDGETAVDRSELVTLVSGLENPSYWPRDEIVSWPSETPLEDHPRIRGRRLAHAAIEALAELEHAGMVQSVTSDAAAYGNGLGDWTIMTSDRPGRRTGTRVREVIPLTGPRYRLAPRAIGDGGRLLTLDVDMYLSGLEEIAVDARAARSLIESLDAYQAGLHLAAASLLGSTVEGVWMHTAERLTNPSSDLRDALDRSRPSVAAVQAALIEMIRSVDRIAAAELAPHAGLVREIRNYGLHLAQEVDEHLDGYFTEDVVASLFMSTRRHLEILDAAVAQLDY